MYRSSRNLSNKITILIIASALITIIIIIRLFHLQIISHRYFQDLATSEQYGYMELPAQRGEIIIKDHHSDEEFLLATNTTLNLIYADPTLIPNPTYTADKLSSLLFNLEKSRDTDNERISEVAKNLSPELTQEEIDKLLEKPTDSELENQFKEEFIAKISQKQRQEILLATDLELEALSEIRRLAPNGIEIIENYVYAYPPQISNHDQTAEAIAEYVEIPTAKLSQLLKGENRYVVLGKKLEPNISDQIQELMNNDPEDMLTGIGMQEEYFRFYPENSLGSNLIGYVSKDGIGQYGIESTFNTQLQGVAGKFQTKRDSIGRQITVGESVLEAAVDGDDIVLTIDRSIQSKVEQILARQVKYYRADSGQVLIMNPQDGSIIAMAHYPSFDPNNYGDAVGLIEVNFTEEEISNLFPTKEDGVFNFYVNEITLDKYTVFQDIDEEGIIRYYRYENFDGPEVYHNKIISWPYEPGSVFKSIAMAIAIDDGDITPNTTFNDSGPIGVDWNVYSEDYDFEIKNSDGYFGLVDMNTVLAKSLNTGMTFIAKKIGPALFYSYLEKFGFLDRTDIELDTETKGNIEYFEDWSESELATHAFGQGITVTMIQLVNSYCTLANGGVLMQPHIVEEIRHDDGTISETDPHEIRKVISEETSAKMTAMLVNSTENGVAAQAQVEGHLVAGKTGTSQTYKHGRALSGTGTTITSFAGYGPIDDPQFVILVKFDHPRENEWGSQTAAPTFSEIAGYLFDYYNIPPDK